MLGGWDLYQSKTHSRVPNISIQSFALSAAAWLEFQCRIMASQFDPPPFGGLWWTKWVENGTNLNVVPTFLFDFYTHYRVILHCLATGPQCTTRQTDRHATDRAIGIGRLCHGTGRLISYPLLPNVDRACLSHVPNSIRGNRFRCPKKIWLF